MDTYKSMLIARQVRLVLLIGFVIFTAITKVWWLAAIGVILIGLTLWQNKRLHEEIAVRRANKST